MPGPTLRSVAVQRVDRVAPDLFDRNYLSGAGTPVIVTDAMDRWQATTTWTFEFLAERYGSQPIATRPPGAPENIRRVYQLADYIDFIHDRAPKLAGIWLDLRTGLPVLDPPPPGEKPMYLSGGWNAFMTNPELVGDIEPGPYFVDDWTRLLPAEFLQLLQTTRFRPRWVHIGPKGSISRLHQDFLHTHGTFSQIVGRKRFVLFSPEDSPFLYDGGFDPDAPDFEACPLLARATAVECVLAPGETLFIPNQWWHYVVGLDNAISVSYSFFNRSNVGEYFLDLFRFLPDLLEGFSATPEWWKRLGARWVSRGFD